MKSFARIAPALGLICLAGCQRAATAPPPGVADRITQVSVINALMTGRYEGVLPIPELLRRGDFGVGTLDHLDGELIVLEGKAYQVRADGAVGEVGPGRSTPFAVVTPFEADGAFPCPRAGSLAELEARLDEALGRKNSFLAIRVDGRFAAITLRSVPRQEPPYKPLGEVAKGQSVWTREGAAGTLVGVRSPAWAGGITVPGYHWHFLSDDRQVGGHVLDCRILDGSVRFDVCREWLVELDGSPGFDGADLGRDLSRELRRVESSRGAGAEAPTPAR